MPSARHQKKSAGPAARPAGAAHPTTAKKPPRPVARASPKKAPPPRPAPAPKAKTAAKGKGSEPTAPAPTLELPLPGGRHHVLSLSFVRDGDEFLARLETDGGHITELKNRSLDQLLTLVASELEDLLE